jgi:hypothetical protein
MAKDFSKVNDLESLVNQTITYMEQGYKKLLPTKDKVVVVVGITGVGKGTLINYLSGTALKVIYAGFGEQVIEAEKESLNGITISHSTTESNTFLPGVYSPNDKDYSYMDFPGFDDSRGVAHDIATAFFRLKAIEHATEIKILVLVSYHAIFSTSGRGDYIRSTFSHVNNFLKAKDDKDNSALQKAISVVITKSEPIESVDEIQSKIKFLNEQLAKYLFRSEDWADEIEACKNKISTLENQVDNFDSLSTLKLIEDLLPQGYKFTTFSKPTKTGELVTIDRQKILELIEQTEYIEKAKVTTGLTVSHDSKLAMGTAADRINQSIAEEITKSIPQIIGFCAEKINNSESFSLLKGFLDKITNTVKAILQADTVAVFLQKLIKIKNMVGGEKLDANLSTIKKYIKFIDFFKQINNSVEHKIKEWNIGLNKSKIIDVAKLTAINSNYDIKSTKLVITGILVNIGAIMELLKDANIRDLKELIIYSLNSVFFDVDLKHSKLQGSKIVIIAPNWRVDDFVVVDVSGKEAEAHKLKAANHRVIYGQNSDHSGMGAGAGEDGLAGNCGSNGGIFIGIAKNFYNMEKLTVNISGGKGGKGQDGGNGGIGSDSYNHGTKDKAKLIKSEKISESPDGLSSEYIEHYLSEGKSGGKGGDGGKGGKGGLGGKVGYCSPSIINLVKLISKVTNGDDGLAGHCGRGGKNGIDYTETRQIKTLFASLLAKKAMSDVVSDRIAENSSELTKTTNIKSVEEIILKGKVADGTIPTEKNVNGRKLPTNESHDIDQTKYIKEFILLYQSPVLQSLRNEDWWQSARELLGQNNIIYQCAMQMSDELSQGSSSIVREDNLTN